MELLTKPVVEAVAPEVDSPAELHESFAKLYEAHFDFVWRSVRGLGVTDRDLDDAVQEVFIVVHRQLPHFEGRSSLRSWLFGIARRVASDHRRRARRKDRGEELRDDRAIPAAQLDAIASQEARRTLHEILNGIDEDKREVFVLVELEHMTMPEVAEVLGINLNTAYSRLRAARIAFNDAVALRKSRALRGDR